MSGLRFESTADMPDGMRALYQQQTRPQAAPPPKEPKSKYHNTETVVDGIRFKSCKEAQRFIQLRILLHAGAIQDLRLQPQYTLQESYITETGQRIRAIRYTADFSYIRDEKRIVEDVKSAPTKTKEYQRNKKFMRSIHGIDIQEV